MRPSISSFSALPADIAGTYVGEVELSSALNAGLGGRFDMVVSPTGILSGKFTLGVDRYGFAGATLIVDEAGIDPVQAQFVLNRPGKTALNVNMVFDPAHNRLASGTLTEDIEEDAPSASFSGWRNIWKGNPATAYVGYHTFYWKAQEVEGGDERPLPQGNGYGSFKIAATGIAPVIGKLADGTSITSSAFIGEDGQVLVFQTLYSVPDRGSISGTILVDSTSHAVSGSVDWSRGVAKFPTARTYPLGFASGFDAVGGLYTPPVSPKVVLGIDPGMENAQVEFFLPEDAIESQVFSVGVKSRITYPLGVRISTVAIIPTTGLVNGVYTRKDANPLKPSQMLTRRGNYNGIIVNEGTTPMKAYGFMPLPRLPQVAGESVVKTLIDSLPVEVSAIE